MSHESFSVYDLSPGKVLAHRFRLGQPLRNNGLIAVFGVSDVDGTTGDLLYFSPSLFHGVEQARALANSFEAWRRVRHAAVPHVRDVILQGAGPLFVFTETAPEETLRARLKHGKLTAADALRLGRQLASGLVEIHAHGLVHGDLKPDTIHLRGSGDALQVLMVDGGVTPGLWQAKHLGERTALIGTPFYAPIEQFGGEAPDVQSDVYNLATTLFECVAGVLPWPGKHFLEVFQAKLDKRPPIVRARAAKVEISDSFEDAIARGLMADRASRFGTAQEFLDALNASS
jgi:serine/threonine-protein kinase